MKVKSVIPTPYVIPAKLVPAEAGAGMTIALDSHWIPAGVYPCESRGGNDNCNLAGRPEGDQPDESGFPLEFTPAKAGAGMTIATGNDNCTGLGKDTENGDKVSEYFFREIE